MDARVVFVALASGCAVSWLAAQARANADISPAIDMAGKGCLAVECHGDLRQRPFVHPPVIQGDCQPCHIPAETGPTGEARGHRFQTVRPTLALCGQCHRGLAATRKVGHGPFYGECIVCHDPHGGSIRWFLKEQSPGDLCLKCHPQAIQGKSYLHPPAALKECLRCHVPHTSEFAGLLARAPDRLCFLCHVDLKKGLDHAASAHVPARKACSQCHNPHGGQTPAYLPLVEPDLCRRCHADTLTRMDTARYSHAAMVKGKRCSDCHDPHWSKFPRLMVRSPMEICLMCHDKAVRTQDGRTLPSIGDELTSGSVRHGPVRNQDCTPCHAAHGSEDNRLLKRAFPEGFYVAYSEGEYALCFGCHDSAIIEQSQTRMTGFRNGDRNLHYIHVRGEKGHSCRACHHEHASLNPFEIRDRFPFGTATIEIQFKVNASGGTCLTGCHRPRTYDREHAVDNPSPTRRAP